MIIDYGKIEFNGKEYKLLTRADYTSRLLNYPKNYIDVNYGEEFDFEMLAVAENSIGKQFIVYWIFSDIKGNEKQLCEFDYSKPNRIEVAK